MCGRFVLVAQAEVLSLVFDLRNTPDTLSQRFNIAPSQQIAIVTNERPRELAWHKWGLIPGWAKDARIGNRLINARSETAAEKPSFRSAFRRRRCLIPASGFFEWLHTGARKQPVYISLREQPLFAFAGLWEQWIGPGGDTLNSATILTTEANEFVAPIHQRMPVILAPEDYDAWLQPADREAHQRLLQPCAPDIMQAWSVSTFVNRPGNDSPETIEPLEEQAGFRAGNVM